MVRGYVQRHCVYVWHLQGLYPGRRIFLLDSSAALETVKSYYSKKRLYSRIVSLFVLENGSQKGSFSELLLAEKLKTRHVDLAVL